MFAATEKCCSQPPLEKLVFQVNGGKRNSEIHGPTRYREQVTDQRSALSKTLIPSPLRLRGHRAERRSQKTAVEYHLLGKTQPLNHNLTADADACTE